MLLAEELLLLLARKALRKTPPGPGVPSALAAAVLVELADAAPRDALRAELTAVLVDDAPPTTRTGALIGLLHTLTVVREILPGMRPAGLFRAAWLARESWPVHEFTRTVAACERAGNELPDLVIGDDRWS